MKTPPCGGGVLEGGEALDSDLPTRRKDNPAASEKQDGEPPQDWRRLGTVATGIFADLRRQRQVAHLCQLGVLPVYRALAEAAGGAGLDQVLDAYGRLDPEIVRALRGDRFPPPFFAVRSK